MHTHRETRKVRVTKVVDEAEDIRSYELVDPDGASLPDFTAGAHIDFVLPSGLIRQYSLANDPIEQHRYRIAVLREVEGRGGSAEVHEVIKEGDLIEITEPINNFPLSDHAKHHLLIAGGIGITPVLSMALQLQREGQPWTLHYCTRTESKTAFTGELLAEPYRDRVTIHHDQGDPAQGLDVKALLAEVVPETHVYCCGPAGLMRAVREAGEHWPTGTQHFEHFAVDESELSDAPIGAFKVEIASTGQVLDVPADKSLLDVLEANGFEVPSMCTEGLCGTCLVDVLEGEPDHRDFVLDDEEKEANNIMTVCCSRALSPKLKLDL